MRSSLGIVASSHPRAAVGGPTITDDFDRADSTDLGSAWSEVSGSWEIASGRLRAPANNGDALLRSTADVGSADHYAEVDCLDAFSGVNRISHVLVRYAPAADTFYMGRFLASTSRYQLFRRVTGTFTMLAESGVVSAPAVPYRLRLEVVGSALTLKVDGSTVLTATDSTITGNQRVGLRSSTSTGFTNDFDNFEAGTL